MPQTQSPTYKIADSLVQLVALGIQFRYIAPTWMRTEVGVTDLSVRAGMTVTELLAYARGHIESINKQLPAHWSLDRVTPEHFQLSRR